MLGPLTAGKKAAEYGYKAYGVPGAVIAGAGGAAGVAVAKKGVEVAAEGEVQPADPGEGTVIEVEEASGGGEDADDPARSASE